MHIDKAAAYFAYTPQFDTTDCAAACFVMIARAFGDHLSITSARQLLGTDTQGTPLNGLVTGAQKRGYQAQALRSPDKRLPEDAPVPFIAHLDRPDNRQHYVVVERIKGTWLWIADPDPRVRRRKIAKAAFDADWSGPGQTKCKEDSMVAVKGFQEISEDELMDVGGGMVGLVILGVISVVALASCDRNGGNYSNTYGNGLNNGYYKKKNNNNSSGN